MSRHAPCPYCEETVDALACLDAKECVECGCPRKILYALADGDVTHDDLVEQYGTVSIKPDVRRELEEKREEMEDPAERDQYLETFHEGAA